MWKVIYHYEVETDLKLLGYAEARRVLQAINEKIVRGEPHKTGKPLSGELAGCRRIRVGNTRIIYKINNKDVDVFVIAAGARQDDFVYERAKKRA